IEAIREWRSKSENAPARARLSLKHGDIMPRPRQFIRRRKPRQSRADDDYFLGQAFSFQLPLAKSAHSQRRKREGSSKSALLQELSAIHRAFPLNRAIFYQRRTRNHNHGF